MQRKSLTVLSVKDVICTAVHQYISQVVVKLDFQVLSKLKETRFNQGLKKARLVRRTRNNVNDKSWPPPVPHKLAKMDFTLFSILNLKKTHLSSLHALSWIHNLNGWSAWASSSTRHQYQSRSQTTCNSRSVFEMSGSSVCRLLSAHSRNFGHQQFVHEGLRLFQQLCQFSVPYSTMLLTG